MKKLLKILLILFLLFILLIAAVLAYLNFVFIPNKIKAEGPAFLERQTKGHVQAQAIEYHAFKGIELEDVCVLTEQKELIFKFDKLILNISPWSLLRRQQIDFRIDLYPAQIKGPLSFKGLYVIKTKSLDLDFMIDTDLFQKKQTILGKVNLSIDKEKRVDVVLNLSSADLKVVCDFYLQDEDAHLEKFTGRIAGLDFDLIGDAQNLKEPSLNIYGSLDLDLASLDKINPKYCRIPEECKMQGRLRGEILASGKPDNPLLGLKIESPQIRVGKIDADEVSLTARMEDKNLKLSKLYVKVCDGEIKMDAEADLNKKDLPGYLNYNIFNLDLNKIIEDISGKDSPVHGRLFSLCRVQGYLKKPPDVEGKMWISASGSNILRLNVFRGLSDILKLPELQSMRFKEATGNFTIAKGALRTDDFRLIGNNVTIYYKGYLDFKGNLSFDVGPNFGEGFLLSAPNIGNILGIFIDSAGNFLGEIKLKGTLKKARHTFKPLSMEKILPLGLEKGLEQLFRFKKKEE